MKWFKMWYDIIHIKEMEVFNGHGGVQLLFITVRVNLPQTTIITTKSTRTEDVSATSFNILMMSPSAGQQSLVLRHFIGSFSFMD